MQQARSKGSQRLPRCSQPQPVKVAVPPTGYFLRPQQGQQREGGFMSSSKPPSPFSPGRWARRVRRQLGSCLLQPEQSEGAIGVGGVGEKKSPAALSSRKCPKSQQPVQASS